MLTPQDKTRMKQLQEQSRLLELDLSLTGRRTPARSRTSAWKRFGAYKWPDCASLLARWPRSGASRMFSTPRALVYSANDLTPLVVQRAGKRAPKDKEKDNAQQNN